MWLIEHLGTILVPVKQLLSLSTRILLFIIILDGHIEALFLPTQVALTRLPLSRSTVVLATIHLHEHPLHL